VGVNKLGKFIYVVAAALAAALVLAACGGGSSSTSAAVALPEEVRTTVREFDEAALNGDAGAMCGLMTTTFEFKAKAELGGDSCESSLEPALEKLPEESAEQTKRQLHELVATAVEINGDKATVSFPEELFVLVRSNGHWLVEETHPQQGGSAEEAAEEAEEETTPASSVEARIAEIVERPKNLSPAQVRKIKEAARYTVESGAVQQQKVDRKLAECEGQLQGETEQSLGQEVQCETAYIFAATVSEEE
jgi:hypothetical protein